MKFFLSACFFFTALFSFAQIDSVRVIEPDRETSFENYELLLLAILGLVVLIGLWFWFKRTRKH